MLKHYGSAFSFAVFAVIAALALGFYGGGLSEAVKFGYTVVLLGVLETSLSFDNAVVNASVLKNWDDTWRHRFLTWGMPIAVFGMRLVFPLAIVAIAAHLNPINALVLAVKHPDQYETILTSVHHEVAAFGGAFLLMVALQYFFKKDKETHWIPVLEPLLQKAGSIRALEIAITTGAILTFGALVPATETVSATAAGLWGLITFILAKGLGELVGGEEGGAAVIKASFAGFLYLELLDASFSFDGVIASFALTNDIFIIALGLGIGAFFVRSMTIHLVETGTLNEYEFLENGAFWAILVLAAIMFIDPIFEVPEWITGLLGAVLIGSAFVTSWLAKKNEAAA